MYSKPACFSWDHHNRADVFWFNFVSAWTLFSLFNIALFVLTKWKWHLSKHSGSMSLGFDDLMPCWPSGLTVVSLLLASKQLNVVWKLFLIYCFIFSLPLVFASHCRKKYYVKDKQLGYRFFLFYYCFYYKVTLKTF